MKALFKQNLEDCSDCCFYFYEKYWGSDCHHPDRPDENDTETLGDEPLAKNRIDDFPKWCPFLKEERQK